MLTLPWPLAQPVLCDDSVVLRPWRDGDISALMAACQDEQIRRWTGVPVPYLVEHAARLVRHQAPALWKSRRGASFAVTSTEPLPSTGPVPSNAGPRLLGYCGLVAVDVENLVAGLGYWMAPWARHHGTTRAAVRLLRDWALGPGGLARLELYIEPENSASRAVAEGVGCTCEGVLHGRMLLRGVRRDLLLYACLTDDDRRSDLPTDLAGELSSDLQAAGR